MSACATTPADAGRRVTAPDRADPPPVRELRATPRIATSIPRAVAPSNPAPSAPSTPTKVPLSALSRKATVAANQKRGLDLKFPDGTSQMTVSF